MPGMIFPCWLVDPKPNLLEWLDSFVKRKGLGKYRLYYPEANTVVVIPKTDAGGRF